MNDKQYDDAKKERAKYTDSVLGSKSRNKVVVAGPGTGKTFLFKELLKAKTSSITLTFINALVEDLSLSLFGDSEVRTLHGFARKVLGNDVQIFRKLPRVIQEDGKILLGKKVNFEQLLNERHEPGEEIEFYISRRSYYGNYYGFTDIVHTLVTYYENHLEDIPEFEQVIVDEFQDFNELEVSLINLLEQKSPVLVAGDDDQALYDFKHAHPRHIRDKHGNSSPDYEPFNLPFCSRCPKVVVDAVSDIVKNAKEAGLLANRIDKPYDYFPDKDKDEISALFSKITYTTKFDTQVAWYIQEAITKVAKALKSDFSVLIISPLQKKAIAIGEKLKQKGFQKVDMPPPRDDSLGILDGLQLLIHDRSSNLGWRIVAESLLPKEDLKEIVKSSAKDDTAFADLLPKDLVLETKANLSRLRKIKANQDVPREEAEEIMKLCGYDPVGLTKGALRDTLLAAGYEDGSKCPTAVRNIPIKTTTIQSSKGLAADVIFLVHVDDKYFLENEKEGVCDKDIYKLLVALTRAKMKAYVVSTTPNKDDLALRMLDADRIAKE